MHPPYDSAMCTCIYLSMGPESARALRLLCGWDNHAGRRRLTEDDVVTADIETARNDHQVSDAEAPKSGARPRPLLPALPPTPPTTTYDDLETLLPDTNLAVPPYKTGAQDGVVVISMPSIFSTRVMTLFANNLLFSPCKTRAKTYDRAARKLRVWSTDDEDEFEGEFPKGDCRSQVDAAKGPGEVKRKQ